MSALTEMGNTALRNMMTTLENIEPFDDFNLGYFLGELSTIQFYMAPDKELLATAEAAIKQVPRARH